MVPLGGQKEHKLKAYRVGVLLDNLSSVVVSCLLVLPKFTAKINTIFNSFLIFEIS